MFRNTSQVAAEAFAAAFGREPDGVWSVPGRVSLMGDHTDLEDGLTFGYAHPARSAVAAARRDDHVVRVITDLTTERIETSLGDIAPQPKNSWQDYPLGTLWAARKHLDENGDDERATAAAPTGMDLFITTDLPIGGGLASSASICGAVAMAVNDLWALGLGTTDLAGFGHRVENEFIGASTGMSDHVTVLAGERGKDVFYDSRGSDISLITGPDTDSEGLIQVLVETGQVHRNWEGVVIDRHESCTRVARLLGYQYLREAQPEEIESATHIDDVDRRRARYVLSEIQRVLDLVRLVRTEGAQSTGHLFNESQRSLREDFEATSDRIDLTTELALASGAIGARMTGSGFGGSVFVLLPREHEDRFRTSIAAAYEEHAWEPPKVYEVSSSDGPRRDV